MIWKETKWITRETEGDRFFFVVQPLALPRFFGRSIRCDIYDRGVFPWGEVIADLPGTFRGEQGILAQRAVSCRLLDDQRNAVSAVPLMVDEHGELLEKDRIKDDPLRPGAKAVQVDTRPRRVSIGQPMILVPHVGHVITRIEWIASTPVRMVRNTISEAEAERIRAGSLHEDVNPDHCWSYIPTFERPTAFYRYVLAFYEVAA